MRKKLSYRYYSINHYINISFDFKQSLSNASLPPGPTPRFASSLTKEKKETLSSILLPNKKKRLFWDDIASKINENSNYFTGEDCRKKFTNLTKAYKTAVKYRAGEKKRSLVRKEIYEEFSTQFCLKPELPYEQAHNESVRRTSEASSSSEPSTVSTPEAIADGYSTSSSKQPEHHPGESSSKVVINSKEMPRPATPSTVESPTITRPVTPTFPQSANVINVTINNNYAGAPDEQEYDIFFINIV